MCSPAPCPVGGPLRQLEDHASLYFSVGRQTAQQLNCLEYLGVPENPVGGVAITRWQYVYMDSHCEHF